MDDEITTEDAAKLLKVNVRTVRWYMEHGYLPGRLIGGRTLIFKLSDVEAFKKPAHPKNRWGKPAKAAKKTPKKKGKK